MNVYGYATNCTFSAGSKAQILGDGGQGNDFLAVLEPATGFLEGGRIVVVGDHNMFTDSYIGSADNTQLATNNVDWAAAASECLVRNYCVTTPNSVSPIGAVISQGAR